MPEEEAEEEVVGVEAAEALVAEVVGVEAAEALVAGHLVDVGEEVVVAAVSVAGPLVDEAEDVVDFRKGSFKP